MPKYMPENTDNEVSSLLQLNKSNNKMFLFVFNGILLDVISH